MKKDYFIVITIDFSIFLVFIVIEILMKIYIILFYASCLPPVINDLLIFVSGCPSGAIGKSLKTDIFIILIKIEFLLF